MPSITHTGNIRRYLGVSSVTRDWGNIEVNLSGYNTVSEIGFDDVYNLEINLSGYRKVSDYNIEDTYNNEVNLSGYDKVVEG